MYSHTLPLSVFSLSSVGGGGGANAATRRLRKKLWERGWFSITLYYLTNNTKHTKAHDTTDYTVNHNFQHELQHINAMS